MEKYWVFNVGTYFETFEMLSNKFKPFKDFMNYVHQGEEIIFYDRLLYLEHRLSFLKCEFLYLYFSVFDQITLNKKDTDYLTENLIKNQIQYLQTISPYPIDRTQEDKLVYQICRMLYYTYPEDALTDYEKSIFEIEPWGSSLYNEKTPEKIKEKIPDEKAYLEGFEKHKNAIKEYIDWLKKGNTGIAAEIEKIIEKTNYPRINDIKIEYLRIKDMFNALQHVDEKDLNVLDRFLSSVIINAPGDAVERNKQLKKLKQQIEHCKLIHKQNNTPVLTIQNAQQVIDNQNGTITIKK
jgi:hypothetical protein